jgi:hypothetical protein
VVGLLIGGAGFDVVTAEIDTAASTFSGISGEVAGQATALVGALADAENGVGDPAAASSVAALLVAWLGPLGLLGPLVDKTSSALLGSSDVYSTTDSAIARAVR